MVGIEVLGELTLGFEGLRAFFQSIPVLPFIVGISPGVALGIGAAAGALPALLGGPGAQTTTTVNQLPPALRRQLAFASEQARQAPGISQAGQQAAFGNLEGLLRGEISPQFQALINQTFQQTAAPLLARASATGNFGGSDFNQLLGGLSGDIATQLFQQALGAGTGQAQATQNLLLGPVRAGAGQGTQTATTPLQGGNPLLGALGGASLGLGLLGQFNALNQPGIQQQPIPQRTFSSGQIGLR
jgi:hypothetical protein